jgi:hypothetical protein
MRMVKQLFMDIWHVGSESWTRLILWQVDEQSFKVVADGTYESVLTNPFYSLIDSKYAPAFLNLSDQVTLQAVKITDHVSKTESGRYVRLKIGNKIDTISINNQNSEGARIWEYSGEIFVSGNLKEMLTKIDPNSITFSLGFSMFG